MTIEGVAFGKVLQRFEIYFQMCIYVLEIREHTIRNSIFMINRSCGLFSILKKLEPPYNVIKA